MDVPKSPILFAKFPSSIIGPKDDIVVDRELESFAARMRLERTGNR